MSKKTLIVIGNGMVGHHFLEQFVASPAAQAYTVRVFGEEKQIAYDRVHLSEYFTGASHADLAMATADWYAEHEIDLHLHEPVTAIDRDRRAVQTTKGSYHYDELVLATGSYPFVPPIAGNDNPHCFVYRTLADLDAIRADAEQARIGVVVGGGLLGLEAANALKSLGLEAHVVEFAPRLMPVQLDADGGALLRQKIEDLGVRVHTEKATTAIVDGDDARLKMTFSDETELDTDLIVFSAGIRPQDTLARQCGLAIGERGGIVIDNRCTTSDPHIHAIGECALWNQKIFGLVAPGYTMARTLSAALNGDADAAFTGADMSTKLKLLGVDVGSIGDAHGQSPGARSIRFVDEQRGHYRRMVVSPDGKKLLGAILVGDNSRYDTLLQYALNGIDLPDTPEALILPESQGGAPVLGADALPETAAICSCHNVTKGEICGVIDDGCTDLAGIKAQTRASTGCGGCAALLKSVVDSELEKRGVAVSKDLCEHFPYSRQELFHLVKVNGIRTFRTLINQYGKGNLKSAYERMAASRSMYLERGRDSSRLTLPTLLPEAGNNAATRFVTPYQSVGARGVNNLASALLLSLLPPNAPFFRLVMDEAEERKIEGIDPKIRTEVEDSLSQVERSISKEIESSNMRVSLFEALKHLIVTGNSLLYLQEDGPVRVCRLDRFVVKRDPMGNAQCIILKETVAPMTLPENLRQLVAAQSDSSSNTVEMYTKQEVVNDKEVEITQEIAGVPVEETKQRYKKDSAPFLALRMIRVDGEDYGRGYVEQYYGDLSSLEGLTKAIVEGSAAAAKILFLVNPNGTTRARTLAESPNGAIREGSANDVSVLQTAKASDFSVAFSAIKQIEDRLSYAFLLTESTIRNADRVTAEEVRLVTQSIEKQLGGIYSVLSQDFQLPMLNRVMQQMSKKKKLPKLPRDIISPTIITGVEALGRGSDLNRLDLYLAGIGQTLGPQAIQEYINVSEYLSRRAASLGIDRKGLVRTEEELATMRQQAQMAQMAQAAGPQAIADAAAAQEPAPE